MKCPKCSEQCERDSVDIGVGILHGPYGCGCCGWSENSEYDLSDGKSPVDEKGGVTDQYGGYYPAASTVAAAYRMAENTKEADNEVRHRFLQKWSVDAPQGVEAGQDSLPSSSGSGVIVLPGDED